MGSYCSVHNDTEDETVMVYIGVNTKVLKPILYTITGLATLASGAAAWGIIGMTIAEVTVAEFTLVISVSAVTAAAGGVVSATNYVLDKVQTKVVNDLAKGGYHKILPGQIYTTSKKTLSLNMRAWVVRIKKTSNSILIRRSDSSVWTGQTSGSNNTYNVLDRQYFSKWKTETIPINIQIPTETTITTDDDDEEGEEDQQYSMINSGVIDDSCFTSTEEDPSSSDWVHVDTTTSTKNLEE